MLTYLLFLIGFGPLIKGADILVSGASSIAKTFNISDMVIGLTIVSFGTSMPELIVSVLSTLQGNADIAIGNVLGSNIANILLILGIAAIFYPLPIQRQHHALRDSFFSDGGLAAWISGKRRLAG